MEEISKKCFIFETGAVRCIQIVKICSARVVIYVAMKIFCVEFAAFDTSEQFDRLGMLESHCKLAMLISIKEGQKLILISDLIKSHEQEIHSMANIRRKLTRIHQGLWLWLAEATQSGCGQLLRAQPA